MSQCNVCGFYPQPSHSRRCVESDAEWKARALKAEAKAKELAAAVTIYVNVTESPDCGFDAEEHAWERLKSVAEVKP